MGIEQLNFVGNDGLVQPFREDVAFVRPLLPFPDHLLQHIRILSSYIIPLSSVFFNPSFFHPLQLSNFSTVQNNY